MSRMQQFAWFNLSVVVLSILVFLALVPFLGYHRALGGFGFLGLQGFGYLFVRPKPGRVLTDERDHLIQQRAMMVAYSIFWVVFVLAAVFGAPRFYGEDGTVPVKVVQLSVLGAWILVWTVYPIAILVQYAGGTTDAG